MAEEPIPLSCRLIEPADFEPVGALLAEAFPDESEAELVIGLRLGEHMESESVAIIDGQIVGYAGLSTAKLGPEDLLILAPVAVHPEHQGRGVGTSVTNHALDQVRGRPISVLGEPVYYARFGFGPAAEFGIEAPFPTKPGALQIMNPARLHRGIINYPQPFLGVS